MLDKYICKEPMQRTQSGEKNMDIYDSDNQKYCNTLRSSSTWHARLYFDDWEFHRRIFKTNSIKPPPQATSKLAKKGWFKLLEKWFRSY